MSTVINEGQIDEIVRQVMAHMGNGKSAAPAKPAANLPGIFPTVEEAMAASKLALQRYGQCSIAQRKLFIQAMRTTMLENSNRLAQMTVEETKLGRVGDKILKIVLATEKTPGVEDLPTGAYVGDDGLTVEEPAPFGTILAILPVTNPNAIVINNAISMLAAGNTVVFAPHPSSKGTTAETIGLLNRAIEKVGGPSNLLVAVADPKVEMVRDLMTHPQINLICATGGKEIVRLAMSSGKRAIGAAAGNPPVLVDETANPEKAARDIVAGNSFDNNLPCVAEKEAIVVEWMADALLRCFASAGGMVLDASYLPRLEQMLLHNNHPNKAFVGKDATFILKQLGVRVEEDIRSIIVETDKNHPFVRNEMMMPILPLVRVGSFDEGIDVAVEVENNLHHTAVIHSANIHHMSEFGKAINTTIFVKNAPSYAGIGFGGEGPTSFTIAGASGEGLTTARVFSRIRRCTLVGAFSLV